MSVSGSGPLMLHSLEQLRVIGVLKYVGDYYAEIGAQSKSNHEGWIDLVKFEPRCHRNKKPDENIYCGTVNASVITSTVGVTKLDHNCFQRFIWRLCYGQYDFMKHNCQHFCLLVCKKLGVKCPELNFSVEAFRRKEISHP